MENRRLSKLNRLFAKEAAAMEAANAGENDEVPLAQVDLTQPESLEDLEDPDLIEHMGHAREKTKLVQEELARVPAIDEIESDHIEYSRTWSDFKDRLYGVDMKIKALKTDNEAVETNLVKICNGEAPPRFPDDPVLALNVLKDWINKNTDKTIELMDINQKLILATNNNYRGYETIFNKFHKALKSYESLARKQNEVIKDLMKARARK